MNTTLELSAAAFHFAHERHAGQRREVDGAPFVIHPVEVASLLSQHNYPDEIVAAGLLHDVLEKSEAEREELEARFGPHIAGLVAALTDDPTIADAGERRAALRQQVAEAGDEAAAVFAADKISKVRELRHRARSGDLDRESLERLEHYRESSEMLEALLPGSSLVAELKREMGALHRAAAGPPSGAGQAGAQRGPLARRAHDLQLTVERGDPIG
jgi:(p)ppGpp synthase/HD superfamily hydrolase